MNENKLGTINGKPITDEMLDEFSQTFERNWPDSEIAVKPTAYGKALAALQSLDLSVVEIEALERRAKHESKPLPFFLRSVLQEALAG